MRNMEGSSEAAEAGDNAVSAEDAAKIAEQKRIEEARYLFYI